MIIDLDSMANINLTHSGKQHNITDLGHFFCMSLLSGSLNCNMFSFSILLFSVYLNFISVNRKFLYLNPTIIWCDLFQLAVSKPFCLQE